MSQSYLRILGGEVYPADLASKPIKLLYIRPSIKQMVGQEDSFDIVQKVLAAPESDFDGHLLKCGPESG